MLFLYLISNNNILFLLIKVIQQRSVMAFVVKVSQLKLTGLSLVLAVSNQNKSPQLI